LLPSFLAAKAAASFQFDSQHVSIHFLDMHDLHFGNMCSVIWGFFWLSGFVRISDFVTSGALPAG
jgi:hypothetical protein